MAPRVRVLISVIANRERNGMLASKSQTRHLTLGKADCQEKALGICP
jgi:hypothetical protein